MFWTVTLSLLQGLRQAAVLFGLTLAFSLPLGLLVALGSMSRCRPVRAVFDALVWVIRGTPLVLQLIIIFYGPGLWLGRNIWGSHRMLACIVAFVLNYACYFSVIYRGGIQAIPAGQREAGQVLGMTRRQIFFRVTLLQVIKRILPPMSNEIITLVKDTSLARIIAIVELTKAGEDYVKSAGITWPLFYTRRYIYLLFVGLLTLLFRLSGAPVSAISGKGGPTMAYSEAYEHLEKALRRHPGAARISASQLPRGSGAVHHRLLRQRQNHPAAVPELFGAPRRRCHFPAGRAPAGCVPASGPGAGPAPEAAALRPGLSGLQPVPPVHSPGKCDPGPAAGPAGRRDGAGHPGRGGWTCWTRSAWSDRAGHYPHQLSGGQKQRVAIARALCHAAGHAVLRRAHLRPGPGAYRRGAARSSASLAEQQHHHDRGHPRDGLRPGRGGPG